MNQLLKWIILCIGMGFIASALILLIKKKINERHTLVWITGSIVIFILSVNPDILDRLANWAGVDYPPTLLFLFSVLILLLVVLYQSMQLSILNEKIKELSQYIAVRDVLDGKEEKEKTHYPKG